MLRNDLKPWKVYSIFMHIKQLFHNVKMLVHYESSDVVPLFIPLSASSSNNRNLEREEAMQHDTTRCQHTDKQAN